MKRIVAAFAALLIAAPTFAADITGHIGEPYAEARSALMADGWQAPASERDCGARNDVCDAYQETLLCSGTGAAFCSFRFINARGEVLQLVTTGEDVADLVVHDAFAVVE